MPILPRDEIAGTGEYRGSLNLDLRDAIFFR